MTKPRPWHAVVAIGLALLLLAGCGPMPVAEPTPAPIVDVDGDEEAEVVVEEVVGTPATPSGELTLGALAERVNAAWAGVGSYRATFTGGPVSAPPAPGTPLASPVATPVAGSTDVFTSVREVVLPDRQRQTVSGAGADDHEAILAGGRLYLRGPLAAQIVPGTDPETWLTLDPASVTPESRLSILLGGLPDTPPSPLAGVPERLWPQGLRDLGEVTVDGRACRAYAAADTVTATGMRVDYTIAVDENDLPCFIETSAGGTPRGREEYSAIDAELEIEAPAAATPVAAIPVALATPSAHD
jgi:hypothetical protein